MRGLEKNRMGRGQTTYIHADIATTRSNRPRGADSTRGFWSDTGCHRVVENYIMSRDIALEEISRPRTILRKDNLLSEADDESYVLANLSILTIIVYFVNI